MSDNYIPDPMTHGHLVCQGCGVLVGDTPEAVRQHTTFHARLQAIAELAADVPRLIDVGIVEL